MNQEPMGIKSQEPRAKSQEPRAIENWNGTFVKKCVNSKDPNEIFLRRKYTGWPIKIAPD